MEGDSPGDVRAMEMNVVELRDAVRKLGVDVKKVKKKRLAEILERSWKERAGNNKKAASGEGGEKEDGGSSVLDDDADGGFDDHLGDCDNKKRRPRTALM